MPEIVWSERTIAGRIVPQNVTRDVLPRLASKPNPTIDTEMFEAGRWFRQVMEGSELSPLSAVSLDRVFQGTDVMRGNPPGLSPRQAHFMQIRGHIKQGMSRNDWMICWLIAALDLTIQELAATINSMPELDWKWTAKYAGPRVREAFQSLVAVRRGMG